MDARIATQQTNLTAELNAANQTLQEIPMQLTMVNEIFPASESTGLTKPAAQKTAVPTGLAMRHYHQAAIESANGVQLIVALYDGLQRFLTQAAWPAKYRTRQHGARPHAALSIS